MQIIHNKEVFVVPFVVSVEMKLPAVVLIVVIVVLSQAGAALLS